MPPLEDLTANLTIDAEKLQITNTTPYYRFETNTGNYPPVHAYEVAYSFVTRDELDDFAKKIYEIISTHTKIDITEEEFMKIVGDE